MICWKGLKGLNASAGTPVSAWVGVFGGSAPGAIGDCGGMAGVGWPLVWGEPGGGCGVGWGAGGERGVGRGGEVVLALVLGGAGRGRRRLVMRFHVLVITI